MQTNAEFRVSMIGESNTDTREKTASGEDKAGQMEVSHADVGCSSERRQGLATVKTGCALGIVYSLKAQC